jgi:hypothetical protein
MAANAGSSPDDETRYADALRTNDLAAARDIARVASARLEVQQPPVIVKAATWHNQAGYASVLMDDEAQARIDYDRACDQAKVESKDSTNNINCNTGQAFVAFFGGDKSTGTKLATDVLITLRERRDLAPATVLANLILATDALTRTDPNTSDRYLGAAITAFDQLVPETQPALAGMLARTLLATGNQYADSGREDDATRVDLKAVEVHASAVGRDNPDLLSTLSLAILGLTNPQDVRKISLWTIAIALKDGEYKQAHAALQTGVMNLTVSNFPDDALQSLWNWQARVERDFGVDSAQAGQGLVDISDFLFQQGDSKNALTLREKGLKLIEAKLGKDSAQYHEAEATPGYTLYINDKKAVDDLKKSLDTIFKQPQ